MGGRIDTGRRNLFMKANSCKDTFDCSMFKCNCIVHIRVVVNQRMRNEEEQMTAVTSLVDKM